MDEKCAKTLEALSTFIESQKALLTRTQADIARLRSLRDDIAETPDDVCCMTAYADKLHDLGNVKLSSDPDVMPAMPEGLHWSVLASSDSAPLRALATVARSSYMQSKRPPTKQTSPLSSLQQLVRTSRAAMVDPLLASLHPLSSDEEEEPLDPEELQRMQERQKIRELKKRRIHGDNAFHGLSGLGLRKSGVEAVFVRRDQEDESAEVDIDLGDTGTPKSASDTCGKGLSTSSHGVAMDVDTPATSVHASDALTPTTPPDVMVSSSHSSRTRRPTQKAMQSRKQSSRKKTAPPPSSELGKAHAKEKEIEGPLLDKKGKPRPETYKQAWSVSEQHLLERLLEEIPDGEKNRWAKISQAMDGRRTARQVASRVQKYYEKLKRFGLDVGNSNAPSRGNST